MEVSISIVGIDTSLFPIEFHVLAHFCREIPSLLHYISNDIITLHH